MNTIANLPIKSKLILVIMSTTVIALLAVGIVLVIIDQYTARQSMAARLSTLSLVIADRSTAVVSFGDQKGAIEMLSALRKEAAVIDACIYNNLNIVLAKYAFASPHPCPTTRPADGFEFTNESLYIYQSIVLDGELIGSLFLAATLHELDERLGWSLITIIAVLLFASLMAYVIASRQQVMISRPILDLAYFADKISAKADYSVMLPQGNDDEIGDLYKAFNNMLEHISRREVVLRDSEEQVRLLLDSTRSNEKNLAITLNSIGDAVIVTDAEGNVTRMNPVAEKLTGWTFEEAKEQSLKTVFPIVNASTRESIDNPIDKVLSSGEIVYLSNHTTLISKDGTEYQIADSAAPIRDDDKILGMVLVFNDVTEQYKLREAATKNKRDLQAIMDHSPAVIYVKDTEGCYTFVNRRFEELFHKQRKDIIGRSDHDVFEKDLADEFQRNDRAVLVVRHALESEEVVPQDDGLHSYISIKFPIFNDMGNAYAVCGISTDITDRRLKEEQLRVSQKMDAMGKLTGGVAHDYNNLLGIIQGYAELLNDQLTQDSDLSRYAKDIEHAAMRGAKLTKKLLAFSQHTAPDAKTLNINELLKEQQLMMEKILTARIKLVYDLEQNLWPVWLDSNDLEDAMVNMSINAMHAMEAGGEFTIRTSNEQLSSIEANLLNLKAGDYVLLSMTDTGKGMDKETKERIFDPFFSTKGERGTGLGLSQVYGFIDRSRGAIKVFSELDHGTRFALYFPRSDNAAIDTQAPEIHPFQKFEGDETLLVVDDEPSMVHLASTILTKQGYRVLTANDGEQALEILKKEKIDMMISDVIMPNMNGYELAEQVQKHYPQVKIQIVSGFADDPHINLTDNTIHQNILYKPYTLQTLLARVRSVLDEGNIKADKLSGRTIMVIDDEKPIRELFEINLTKLGCKTLVVSNGEEAIELYRESMNNDVPIDIIIMDVSIPGGMDGKEIANKIRDLNPNARMIVASGHSEGPEMQHYQKYGFRGALEKNFDRETMKQVLEQVMS